MKLRDQAYQRFTHGLLAREIHAGQFVSQRELRGSPAGARGNPRADPTARGGRADPHGPTAGDPDRAGRRRLIRNAFGFRLMLEREAFARFAERAGEETLDRLQAEHGPC